MPEVMNLYRIPMASFDPSLGSRYHSAEGRPRPLDVSAQALQALIGQRVLFPPELLPAELQVAHLSSAHLALPRLGPPHLGPPRIMCYGSRKAAPSLLHLLLACFSEDLPAGFI